MKAKFPERSERLRGFFNHLNINNKTVASRLGIKPAFISQLLNAHATVTPGMALRFGKIFPNLNVDWLLTGDGEMELADAQKMNVLQEEPPLYLRNGQGMLEGLIQRLESMEREMKDLKQWKADLEGRLKE